MTVVETTSGPIEGRDKEGTLLFAGVPYAAPPVGEPGIRARDRRFSGINVTDMSGTDHVRENARHA